MGELSKHDFDTISRVVRERSAIVLEAGKEYLVESRLAPIVTAHRLSGMAELAAKLRTQPNSPLAIDVIDAMTTNETSFFRDIRPFEALRTSVLPELVAARRDRKALTIWCAACSSGQEPYSVAMTLAEHFPEIAGWHVRIIATDLSTAIVKQAEQGAYRQMEVNRGVPAPMLVKYFDRNGMTWSIKPELRKRVEFRVLNLVAPFTAMPTVDLVLLRNVLIYFDNQAREQILSRVHGTLASDGYLMLGSTESTIGLDAPFRRDTGTSGCLRPVAGPAPARRAPAGPASAAARTPFTTPLSSTSSSTRSSTPASTVRPRIAAPAATVASINPKGTRS
jgi:chemotaxis protein methyltransferase CheR